MQWPEREVGHGPEQDVDSPATQLAHGPATWPCAAGLGPAGPASHRPRAKKATAVSGPWLWTQSGDLDLWDRALAMVLERGSGPGYGPGAGLCVSAPWPVQKIAEC